MHVLTRLEKECDDLLKLTKELRDELVSLKNTHKNDIELWAKRNAELRAQYEKLYIEANKLADALTLYAHIALPSIKPYKDEKTNYHKHVALDALNSWNKANKSKP